MFEQFESYIHSKGTFTQDEIKLMCTLSVQKKLRRRQLLMHQGEVCRYKTFVTAGLLRTYSTKDDGTEYLMKFAAENSWCIDPESYNNQTPSRYSIEALEETEVILWTKESFEQLFEAMPHFKTISEKIITAAIDENQNRVLMHISYSAEEKYQEFVNTFPDIFNRVPLHMVASYLGLSRETLSRVRHAQLRR